MKKNIGKVDRHIRFIVSGLLIYTGYCQNPIVSGGMSKSAIGVFGIMILLTALLRICPLYWVVDIDTTRYD